MVTMNYFTQGSVVHAGYPILESNDGRDMTTIGDLFPRLELFSGAVKVPVESGWIRIFAGPAEGSLSIPVIDYCVLSLAYSS